MKHLACGIFLLSLITLGGPAAYSCECGVKGSPHKELGKARVVFVGEVVEVKEGVSGEPNLVKFRVERYWKGVKGEFITISSPGGLCGFVFRVNQKWLIYSYDKDLWTDSCHRTTQLMYAAEDLRELGKAKIPKTTAESRQR